MAVTTIDLDKKFTNKTITLKNNSNDTIRFKNDVSGQISYFEKGDDVVIAISKATPGTYTYTKYFEIYEKLDDTNSKFKLTTTKYVYDKNNGWKISVKPAAKTVTRNDVPAEILQQLSNQDTGSEKSYAKYIQNYSTDSIYSLVSFTSEYIVNDLSEKDNVFKEEYIDVCGFESKTLVYETLGTVTIKNGEKAKNLEIITDNNGIINNVFDINFDAIKSGNTFNGSYLNETATSGKKDEIFSLKGGKDTINYSFDHCETKAGKDIINLSKNEILNINLLSHTKEISQEHYFEINPNYIKKGDDLIIKFTRTEIDSNKIKTADFGQTTIKNYFKIAKDNVFIKYDYNEETKESVKDNLEYVDNIGIIGNANTKKSQNLTGNFLDQIFFGGKEKDTIKAKSGDNIIIGGLSDDKIYGGKGTDDIIIYSGESNYNSAKNIKGDKLYNLTSKDSLNFYSCENDCWDINYSIDNPNVFKFEKSGNDFIVKFNGRNGNNILSEDKVTLVDYFKQTDRLTMINEKDLNDYANNIIVSQKGKDKISGTKFNDNITAKGKLTVSTGSGNDILNLKADTNDTINITGTDNGSKEINIIEGAKIKFNKTVNFKNTDANLKINLPYKKDGNLNYTIENNSRTYIKKGNNLLVGLAESDYTKDSPVFNKSPKAAYIIKDYFSNKDNLGKYALEDNIAINTPNGTQNLVLNDLNNEINNFKLLQTGNTNKASKYSDTYYNDVIVGGNLNDKYNISAGGDDIIFDTKGNDTYNIANIKDSLIINDKKGNDTINIKNANNFGLYFDVNLDENKKPSATGKDLRIFDTTKIENQPDDSKNIVGGLTIKNYLSENSTAGNGCIENITLGTNKINININSITNSVANWLADNGYSSSAEVFAQQKQDGDINALIAAYTS